MNIVKTTFGTTQNQEAAFLFTLENDHGMKAVVTNYGASLVSLLVPDNKGEITDVVLGYDTLEEYEDNGTFFGNTIGRNGNRIEGGRFTIDGIEYQMIQNENGNSLHSCPDGYNTKAWDANVDEENNAVTFSYISPDMQQGFPGTFHISVTYTLTQDNELILHYQGKSDKKTVANLTNHSYFNLNGHDQGTILNHKVTLNASHYTPVIDSKSIPTGEIAKVEGTPMDFTQGRIVGQDIDSDFAQLQYTDGYDHNFVVNRNGEGLVKFAEVENESKSRKMEVYTDLPGFQFYSGNFIDSKKGKSGVTYDKRHGLCLETQYFPNAVNEKEFPSPIIDAGEKYDTKTIYKFI